MLDISPKLDDKSKEPLYMQLYQYFKEEITSGRIPAETRLPSIRQLCDYLKVSKTTVETTYQQLLAEGYIVSRERSGFYVVELERDLFSSLLGESSALMESDGRADQDRMIRYDFHMSRIDADYFPFALWRKLANQGMQESEKELLYYGERQGEAGLRQEISKYLRHARGVQCTPDQIVIGAGTQFMIGLLCQMIGLSEKAIAMEDPGYQDVRSVISHHGFEIVPIPLEDDGIDVERLASSHANVVYITPSHQYPTGVVMPIVKRTKLLQWAEETNGLIIEDDYDGEFRYRGKPIPSLQGLDPKGNVVYLGTFSKALIPSIRISYMVLPERLLDLYRQRFLTYDQTVSRLHQRTLQLFMESGEWERHIRRMRTVYQRKHDMLLQTIKSVMKDHVRITGQDAGLHLVIEVKTQQSADELVGIAETAGIRVYSTTNKWLFYEEEPPPKICIGFGGLKLEEIQEGIQRLHECWLPYYTSDPVRQR